MTPSRRRSLLTAITGALALLGLLAGCAVGPESADSGSGGDSSAPQQQESAPDEGGAEQEAAPEQGQGEAPAERAVVTTTSADLVVTDVPAAVTALNSLVSEYGGYVESRDESLEGERPTAWITTRVPAERHDEFLTELGEFGEVTSVQSSAEDVTLTKVDLESRISALESSIASLEAMLESTENVTELLEVEEKLSERQAELQSLESQLEVLEEDVAMSTVSVNFSTERIDDDAPSGFWGGLTEGWNDFVESLGRFFQGIGYAIPGLVLLAALALIIWFALVRRLIRRRRRGADARPGGRGGEQRTTNGHGGPMPPSNSPTTVRPDNDTSSATNAEPDPARTYDGDAPTPQQRLADGLPPLPPGGDR